jgi:hypothetical protein
MDRIHDAGGFTIAQDEKSCVVFGMPKAAIDEGSVDEVVHLNRSVPADWLGQVTWRMGRVQAGHHSRRNSERGFAHKKGLDMKKHILLVDDTYQEILATIVANCC